ncbi:MAG: ATP:cob(I)alamin adenosyltransferase [Candidatus Hydrogenedentes bacterium]|nr:ATP:cob(I)alamin adenosyltransferase [Candidatus Hydrogenedentota bacterium]
MKSRVTTKQGDQGQTRALSGDRYSKSHLIMECVGSVDELRAQTALVRLLVLQEKPQAHEHIAEFLFWLLHTYFLVGTECSDPMVKHPEYRKAALAQTHVDRLEAEQMDMEAKLKLSRKFIVSASNVVSAHVDIAATLARRLERNVVRLKEAYPEFDVTLLLIYLNRLSDTLYILARYLDGKSITPVDYSVLER